MGEDPAREHAQSVDSKREDSVRAAFERLSADYDARFPRIIPRYAEFHGVVVQRVAEHVHGRDGRAAAGRTWLDLGCGTGELSRRLLEAVPGLRLHCLDLAPAMIERAREKLAAWEGQVSFAVGHFLTAPLPGDAAGVVSALAVHHLEGAEKRALFERLHRGLAPGALLVLGDAVNGGSEAYTDYYLRRWVEHMRASGMTEDEIAGVLRDHDQNDRFSTLDEQMAWLLEAGFRDLECPWKYFLLVVVAGQKR
jgi:tRNA (cmo5U34)-methyltransferase